MRASETKASRRRPRRDAFCVAWPKGAAPAVRAPRRSREGASPRPVGPARALEPPALLHIKAGAARRTTWPAGTVAVVHGPAATGDGETRSRGLVPERLCRASRARARAAGTPRRRRPLPRRALGSDGSRSAPRTPRRRRGTCAKRVPASIPGRSAIPRTYPTRGCVFRNAERPRRRCIPKLGGTHRRCIPKLGGTHRRCIPKLGGTHRRCIPKGSDGRGRWIPILAPPRQASPPPRAAGGGRSWRRDHGRGRSSGAPRGSRN
jgi:hypothetical protein